MENKIKAAYLYNFTKFIVWPLNDAESFNLCIFGKDPFGSVINPIEKRTVKNKPIRLFRLQSSSEVRNCHMIYFGVSNIKWSKSDLVLPGVLTVSSLDESLLVNRSKQFTEDGDMIGFFLKDGKVKLQINLQVLRDSGLEVSAKLLEVAEVYEGISDD